MTTILSMAQRAKAAFERNIDTIVAAFLIRHPDVDPAEVELVMEPGEKMQFYLRKRGGVKLPEYMRDGDKGWNACIDEVKRLNALPFGAMTTTVAEQQGITDVEVK
jgi:hypothetical protein